LTADRDFRSAKIVSVETRHAGWCKLLVATIALPDGRSFTREIEDHGNAACVLPFDPARRTAIVIRQLRAPVLYAAQRHDLFEAIAGLIDDDAPAEAVKREAMEEAGLRLSRVEHVTTSWTMPGISTERMDLFLAEYAVSDRVAAGGGLASEHEDIEVLELPLGELAAMIDGGRDMDIKLMSLMQTLRLRRPELFG
jgi:nudix-type nucleoside diphosphatase (YffH/AdpP family)